MQGLRCRDIFVDCCGWLVNQDGVLYQNPLENGSVKRGTWVWTARARTWRPRSPHGSRLEYVPWLISCGLFCLNTLVWRDAPTIPTTTKRSFHYLAILKHQHHNKEYNVDNNNYNDNVKKQFLESIHKKDLLLLPTPIEVAFHATNSPEFYSWSNQSISAQ